MLTDGASAVAKRMGISDLVVGLTVVAFGTSAPELVISVVSAINGNAPLAVGNVVGSNIFNVFLVLGAAATVRPLPFGGITVTDLLVMTGSAVLFLTFGWFFGNRTITRVEGGILSACYIAYMIYLVSQAG